MNEMGDIARNKNNTNQYFINKTKFLCSHQHTVDAKLDKVRVSMSAPRI